MCNKDHSSERCLPVCVFSLRQEPDILLRHFRKYVFKQVFYLGELENDAVFKARCPSNQGRPAVLSTMLCLSWQAFAFFPQKICNEPRFQQCVDEAGASKDFRMFEEKRIACGLCLYVASCGSCTEAMKLGNEHRRSASPGAVLEVDGQAL